MLEITIKAPNLEYIKSQLRELEKKAPQILARVLNRTLTNVKKNISVAARDQYIVKTADIKATLSEKKATTANPQAAIKSYGNRILLYNFRVSPKNPRPKNPPVAYKAKVLKKSGLKAVSGGFVAQMQSGHLGIFKRAGQDRTPIKELTGVSVPQMIGSKEVIKKIQKEADRTINTRLNHEIKQALKQ